MEEIGATNPEYQPLRVLWRCSCAHARKTIPMAPIHSFTKQLVPSMYQESLTRNRFISMARVFRTRLINSFFHQKNVLGARRFFSCFIFIAHFYRGLAGACVNPGRFFFKLFLCIHFFVK